MPQVYRLAYWVKTILATFPDQQSAVGFFLLLALQVFETCPYLDCEYTYTRNKYSSSHINCLEQTIFFPIITTSIAYRISTYFKKQHFLGLLYNHLSFCLIPQIAYTIRLLSCLPYIRGKK